MTTSSAGGIRASLIDYDATQFGPLLGVSDEGSAVPEVVRAALEASKARAAKSHDPSVVGIIVDGERMTSGGEAPIGPDQYADIIAAVAGHAYCTTNVSIRVNARADRPFPEAAVTATSSSDELANTIESIFRPFVLTPDGAPRPLLVRLRVPHGGISADLERTIRALDKELSERRRAGKIGPPSTHRLALLIDVSGVHGEDRIRLLEACIELAGHLGMEEVAIDGHIVVAARARMGAQGLLSVLEPAEASYLLKIAAGKHVRLSPRFTCDELSAAVGVWTGMQAAHHFGFHAAKYGLTPLTLSEQDVVIEAVQHWSEIDAIPAFYADTPVVTDDRVYLSDDASEALRLWLKMVRGHGARIVLVDCPDRITPRIDKPGSEGPRPLVRTDQTPNGVFSVDEIAELDRHARDDLGIKVLWSGGINRQAAFDLGNRKVFGIFTTSSTARQVRVGQVLLPDPQLASENEPDFYGVRQVHALLQAGFLCAVLTDKYQADALRQAASRLIAPTVDDPNLPKLIEDLDADLVAAWLAYWASQSKGSGGDKVRAE
ncbi:hypothetical protein ACAG24_024120 [Mycobacterium sp. pW049]|uniref:hypothetical protein n=1 Tax=[Mycobacterium] bulgaricum TaxID=3238985 RepID=UPI00351B4445